MAENILYINDDNFAEETKTGTVLIDFYADWCGPCRMMEPVIDELAAEFSDRVKVCKMDIESSQKTPAALGITSIPTIVVFQGGQEVNRVVGVKDLEDLKALIPSA